MNDNEFKKKYKYPACTMAPWSFLIPFKNRPEVMRQIKQETIDAYGEDYTECPKRKICIGKECLGRPLPYKSKTALKYLDKLAETQTIVDGQLFIKGCSGCPIAKSCKQTCPQVNDFMNRHKSQEPTIIFNDKVTEAVMESHSNISEPLNVNLFNNLNFQVPWEILSNKKRDIVRTYLFEQRDFKYVADKFGLSNQSSAKYEFYSALTKLSEYAVMRKFIEENGERLTPKQLNALVSVYETDDPNLTLELASDYLDMSKQSLSNMIARIVKNHNIRWTKFVTKKNNKVIYNVPEILK